MILIIKILFAYFAPWLIGYLLLGLLDRRSQISSGFKFFAAFLIGIGVFTLEVFTAAIFGAPLDLKVFLGIILFDLVILGTLKFILRPLSRPLSISWREEFSLPRRWGGIKGEVVTFIIFFVILIKIVFSFWQVTHIPTFEFDAWNNWNLRAKVIYTEGRLPLDKDQEFYLGGGIKSYPLNDGLWKVFLAALADGWNEYAVNTASAAYYIILLGLFYFSLPPQWGRLGKLGATYLLASLPFLYFHSFIPYADLAFATYLFLTLVSLFYFLQTNIKPYLWVSAIALALTIWTKNEGFAVVWPVMFAAILLLTLIKKLKIREVVSYWLLAIVFSAPWLIFRFANHLDVLSGDSSSFKLVYNSQFFKEAFYSIFLRSHFNFLWLIAFFLIIFQAKKIGQNLPLRFLALTLLALFAFYNGIIIFTDKAYDLSALVRVNLQIAPLVVFLTLLVLKDFLINPLSAGKHRA